MANKKKNKDKIKVDKIRKEYGYLIIGKDYYDMKSVNGKPTFTKANPKEVKKKIKIVKEIAVKLKEGFDTMAVLEEALMKFDKYEDLRNLHSVLYNSKRKYKIRTRRHHCVDIKVGGFIIPISE